MKKAIAILLCFLLICTLPACDVAPEDASSRLLDKNGNLTVSDTDDSDYSAIDEEFEIKTSGTDAAASNPASNSGSGVSESATATTSSQANVPTGTTLPADQTDHSSAATSSATTPPEKMDDDTLPQITVNLTRQTVSDSAYAVFEGSTLRILKCADFSLTGNFYGCIEASLGYNEVLRLRMAGVNLLNTTGPVIKVLNLVSDEKNDNIANNPEDESSIAGDQQTEYDQPDLILSFTEGTTNTLQVKDCNLSDMIGTVYSECSLSIRGHGQGTIQNANQNAIHCLKSVEVRNVELTLLAPAGRGVYTKARYENNSGCSVKISAYRDAIKCDKFYMYGGTLLACSQKNDAIDAEDRAVITGGLLIADTADISSNYGIKVRRILENQVRADKYDTFEISGGTVLASGGFNTQPDAATTTAAYLLLDNSQINAADQYAIKAASGNTVTAFSTAAARPSVLIVSPALNDGSYQLWRGGTVSGATEYLLRDQIIQFSSGLYSGGSYSGGKSVGSVTTN